MKPGRIRLATLGLGIGLGCFANAGSCAQTDSVEPGMPSQTEVRFVVGVKEGLSGGPEMGRLFVIVSATNNPEPRLRLGSTEEDAPVALARDVIDLGPGKTAMIDSRSFSYPPVKPSAQLPGDYWVQGLLAGNADLRMPGAPGNLFSLPRKVHLDWTQRKEIRLELSQRVPPETLPADTAEMKFIKRKSELLTQFHRRPIFLRAGIILPQGFESQPARRYPLWIRIGGINSRYTSIRRLMAEGSDFRKVWMAPDTPRFIVLDLDGAGPYGDPYYVNSANNGPYGDALVQELIPYVEAKYRAVGDPKARVLSGVSTGGWVSLALQVLYPAFFNGAWASCPDPVDFRAFQLLNLYRDENAYADKRGREIPSRRNLKGETTLTMQREVGVENLLGLGNSYTRSGEQWGAWNAVFSPRAADGLPVPIWDPQSGKIDHAVAEEWKRYDLRLVLERNWKTLGPKLKGKLHIASGEADEYFLNNAVHLLEQFLAKADPPFKGSIVYGPGKEHGWSNLSMREMLEEMRKATE
jgi:hypothetical protein